MKIIEYQDKFRDEWEDFVEKSNNGTLFHTQQFLDYHPPERFENHHLIFEHRNRWTGILPAAAKMRDGKKILSSHPGASFGGFACAMDTGVKKAYRMVEMWIKWAKDHEYEGIEFTRVPIVYHRLPEAHTDFAACRLGGKFVKRELTAVLKLPSDKDTCFANFRAEARTSTRKAIKKGVEIDMDGDIPAFYRILESNLGARHNVTPTHTLEELLDLKKRFPEKVHQFNATLDGEEVAGVSVWQITDKALLAFYISHKQSAQTYRPLNLLFWKIFQWAIDRGFEWFDFGTYTLDMEPNFGLARFKEGFGARGIFRDTLRLVF